MINEIKIKEYNKEESRFTILCSISFLLLFVTIFCIGLFSEKIAKIEHLNIMLELFMVFMYMGGLVFGIKADISQLKKKTTEQDKIIEKLKLDIEIIGRGR